MDPSSSPKKSLPESCFLATNPESQHVQVPFLGACEQRYPFTISNVDADLSIIGPQSACFASAMTPIGSCALLNAPVESSVKLSAIWRRPGTVSMFRWSALSKAGGPGFHQLSSSLWPSSSDSFLFLFFFDSPLSAKTSSLSNLIAICLAENHVIDKQGDRDNIEGSSWSRRFT